MKLEADEFCTSMVQRKGKNEEEFALVMHHRESGNHLYFFVSRDMVAEIVQSLVEMVGYDA